MKLNPSFRSINLSSTSYLNDPISLINKYFSSNCNIFLNCFMNSSFIYWFIIQGKCVVKFQSDYNNDNCTFISLSFIFFRNSGNRYYFTIDQFTSVIKNVKVEVNVDLYNEEEKQKQEMEMQRQLEELEKMRKQKKVEREDQKHHKKRRKKHHRKKHDDSDSKTEKTSKEDIFGEDSEERHRKKRRKKRKKDKHKSTDEVFDDLFSKKKKKNHHKKKKHRVSKESEDEENFDDILPKKKKKKRKKRKHRESTEQIEDFEQEGDEEGEHKRHKSKRHKKRRKEKRKRKKRHKSKHRITEEQEEHYEGDEEGIQEDYQEEDESQLQENYFETIMKKGKAQKGKKIFSLKKIDEQDQQNDRLDVEQSEEEEDYEIDKFENDEESDFSENEVYLQEDQDEQEHQEEDEEDGDNLRSNDKTSFRSQFMKKVHPNQELENMKFPKKGKQQQQRKKVGKNLRKKDNKLTGYKNNSKKQGENELVTKISSIASKGKKNKYVSNNKKQTKVTYNKYKKKLNNSNNRKLVFNNQKRKGKFGNKRSASTSSSKTSQSITESDQSSSSRSYSSSKTQSITSSSSYSGSQSRSRSRSDYDSRSYSVSSDKISSSISEKPVKPVNVVDELLLCDDLLDLNFNFTGKINKYVEETPQKQQVFKQFLEEVKTNLKKELESSDKTKSTYKGQQSTPKYSKKVSKFVESLKKENPEMYKQVMVEIEQQAKVQKKKPRKAKIFRKQTQNYAKKLCKQDPKSFKMLVEDIQDVVKNDIAKQTQIQKENKIKQEQKQVQQLFQSIQKMSTLKNLSKKNIDEDGDSNQNGESRQQLPHEKIAEQPFSPDVKKFMLKLMKVGSETFNKMILQIQSNIEAQIRGYKNYTLDGNGQRVLIYSSRGTYNQFGCDKEIQTEVFEYVRMQRIDTREKERQQEEQKKEKFLKQQKEKDEKEVEERMRTTNENLNAQYVKQRKQWRKDDKTKKIQRRKQKEKELQKELEFQQKTCGFRYRQVGKGGRRHLVQSSNRGINKTFDSTTTTLPYTKSNIQMKNLYLSGISKREDVDHVQRSYSQAFIKQLEDNAQMKDAYTKFLKITEAHNEKQQSQIQQESIQYLHGIRNTNHPFCFRSQKNQYFQTFLAQLYSCQKRKCDPECDHLKRFFKKLQRRKVEYQLKKMWINQLPMLRKRKINYLKITQSMHER